MLRRSGFAALLVAAPALYAESRVFVEIPAGPLNDSLLVLGEQAQLSIVFGKESVAPFSNPAISGKLSPEQALQQLLDGTCLSYEFIREALVALRSGCANIETETIAAVEPQKVEAPLPPPSAMEEIVVRERHLTGSRLSQVGVRTPVPLDVITRPEIELSGHQSLGQILRYLPAVAGNSTSTLVTNGGNGTATVTLRGLPASNTLVLLNGRRMNPDALYGGSVDLNTLPIALIERIEVLKDGASAVYGSDAVAGVVNVLTRRDLDGWHADAYVGQSGEGDLDTKNLSLTYARQSDTFRFVGGTTYYEQDPIFSRDRPLSSRSDDRSRGGVDKRSSATTPSRITLPTGGSVILDNGAYRPVTSEDRFEYRDHTSLIVPSRRYSLFLEGEWTRNDVTWFAEVLGTKTESLNTFAPTPLFTGFEKLSLVIDDDQLYNPFGLEIYDLRRRITEASTRRQRNKTETRRGVLGVRGDFDGLGWELVVQESRTTAEQQMRGAINAFAVQQALRGDCVGSCVPLDVFGPSGSIDQEMLAFIAAVPQSRGTSRLRAANLNLDFSAFQVPAGAIEVAMGVEYREESLDTRPDPLLVAGAVLGSSNFAATDGRRISWEAFAEVRVPVLRDRPGVYRLDAYLASRVSNYHGLGRETNPRMLLQYQPSSAWSLRVSYAHGFRAPNLIELFGGTSQSFEQLNDPCSLAANIGPSHPGCLVQSDPSLTQFLTIKGGNDQLLPERSRTFSAGVEWHKQFDTGELRIALDQYRIRQRNVVDTSAQFIVNQNAEGNGFDDRVIRDANGNVNRVVATFLNIGERDVQGLDLTLRATIDTQYKGQFQFALNATHIAKFEDRFAPAFPAIDRAGTFSDAASEGKGALPDWKASIGLGWHQEHWRAQYNVYVVSALDEMVPILRERREMELWATHNAQVSYLGPATKWFRLSIGINNLLDEQPPFSAAAFNDSYDSRTYDITGRYGYLRIERAI